MTQEPVRLLLDPAIGAGLRRDLGAVAHVDVPYDVSAGLARFEGNLAAGTGVVKSAGLSGGKLLGAAALLAGGLTAAVLLWSGGATPPPLPEAPAITAPAIAAPARTESIAPAATPAAVLAPTIAPAAPAVAEEIVIPEDDDEPAQTARPHKRRARPDASTPAAGPTDALREARSLQAARSQLGRDPAVALALADKGAAEFKGGTFAQEWEGVAILALFELGKPTARARGEAFLRTYPSGTYAQRVRQALEN